MRQYIVCGLQLCGSLFALFLTTRKLVWLTVYTAISKLSIFTLLGVFFLYNISQIISAVRSLYYLNAIGIYLNHSQNIALYYLGMFYNTFLPGTVGGDGYKIFMLKKHSSQKTLQLIQVLLLDRLNGFLGLLLIAIFFLPKFSQFEQWLRPWLLFCFIAVFSSIFSVLQYYFIKLSWRAWWHTIFLSVLSQGLQVAAALWIAFSCDHSVSFCLFAFVFILSTIFSQLPISLGGMGARELTAVYFLQWLGLDATTGLLMGSIFFLIQTISNSIGIFFMSLDLSQEYISPSVNNSCLYQEK